MKKEHNYGIDLLRTFLMFLIISGHLLVHTGVRESLVLYSPKWIFTWSYQSIALCAVNCFVLISGYFSNVNSHKLKLKKIIQLYGQVLFYSVGIYVILLLTGVKNFSAADAIHSIFPVLSGQYWFFSSYILLLILMPFLNVMLSKLSNYSLKLLTIIIVVVFYVVPLFSIVFMQYDITEGMGIIGFITLYVIGHSLRRLKIKISKLNCVIGLVVNCAVIIASKFALSFLVNRLEIEAGTGLLYHYNTIFQLINAALLLLLFKDIKLNNKVAKVAKFIGASAFGIYLLHEHPSIRGVIWNTKLYTFMLEAKLPIFIIFTLLIPFALLILCFALDNLRHLMIKLFSKIQLIQKIDKRIAKLENFINEKIDGLT